MIWTKPPGNYVQFCRENLQGVFVTGTKIFGVSTQGKFGGSWRLIGVFVQATTCRVPPLVTPQVPAVNSPLKAGSRFRRKSPSIFQGRSFAVRETKNRKLLPLIMRKNGRLRFGVSFWKSNEQLWGCAKLYVYIRNVQLGDWHTLRIRTTMTLTLRYLFRWHSRIFF